MDFAVRGSKSVHMSGEQMTLPGLFGDGLDPRNRWLRLSQLIPWDEIETCYGSQFDSARGGPHALPARVAFGSLIIKERLGLTDIETVEMIQENPYLQIFLGYGCFSSKRPFDPSLMVHFRKRFSLEELQSINELLTEGSALSEVKDENNSPPPPDSGINASTPDESTGSPSSEDPPPPSGTLMMDATCIPADVAYPTDVNLLNHAREWSERLIDRLHEPHIGTHPKPRTYRHKARKDYLKVAKAKSLSRKRARKAFGKQLCYLRRNLGYIQTHVEQGLWRLSELPNNWYKTLLVLSEILRQQSELHAQKSHQIADRIVSIEQPHVRPIYRGKAGRKYEFGGKVSVVLDKGFAYLETVSWDAFNEAGDLIAHAANYHRRHGHYPERILADKIYRTKANRSWCKERGIRLAGVGPGRPPKDPAKRQERERESAQDDADRQPMEGVFGVTKRRYGLKRILTRLPSTSATTIAMVMIILNLEKIILRLFLTDRHWFTDWNGITMRWRLEAMEIHHQLKTHLRTGGWWHRYPNMAI